MVSRRCQKINALAVRCQKQMFMLVVPISANNKLLLEAGLLSVFAASDYFMFFYINVKFAFFRSSQVSFTAFYHIHKDYNFEAM